MRQARTAAWSAFFDPIRQERNEVVALLDKLVAETGTEHDLHELVSQLQVNPAPIRADVVRTVRRVLRQVRGTRSAARRDLLEWLEQAQADNADRYTSYLYSQSEESALNIAEVARRVCPQRPARGWARGAAGLLRGQPGPRPDHLRHRGRRGPTSAT